MAPAVMALERGARPPLPPRRPPVALVPENVAVEAYRAESRMFHKRRSDDRVDGAIAAAMAVGRASAAECGVSVYTTDRPEGLTFFEPGRAPSGHLNAIADLRLAQGNEYGGLVTQLWGGRWESTALKLFTAWRISLCERRGSPMRWTRAQSGAHAHRAWASVLYDLGIP